MKSLLADVHAFHVATDNPSVFDGAKFPSQDRIDLRMRLSDEEHQEMHDALAARDIVAFADALADKIYIDVGTALEFGIPLDRVWAAVQAANMAKVDPATGKVTKRDDGKILKPVGWTPPDIAAAMRSAPDVSHGFHLFMDGNMWCAVGPHFRDLQQDHAGFGETQQAAIDDWWKNNEKDTNFHAVVHSRPDLEKFTIHA